MNAVAGPSEPFPFAEGLGIFVGIVSWDLLSAGEMEILKASVIAALGALAWYGVGCCLTASRRKRQP